MHLLAHDKLLVLWSLHASFHMCLANFDSSGLPLQHEYAVKQGLISVSNEVTDSDPTPMSRSEPETEREAPKDGRH